MSPTHRVEGTGSQHHFLRPSLSSQPHVSFSICSLGVWDAREECGIIWTAPRSVRWDRRWERSPARNEADMGGANTTSSTIDCGLSIIAWAIVRRTVCQSRLPALLNVLCGTLLHRLPPTDRSHLRFGQSPTLKGFRPRRFLHGTARSYDAHNDSIDERVCGMTYLTYTKGTDFWENTGGAASLPRDLHNYS